MLKSIDVHSTADAFSTHDHPCVFLYLHEPPIQLPLLFLTRYGFNSHGHDAVQSRLKQQIRERGHPPGILGINLGKNKTSDDAVEDYVKGVKCFSGLGDYLVINVSSPNTPGLRSLQGRQELEKLIDKVQENKYYYTVMNIKDFVEFMSSYSGK